MKTPGPCCLIAQVTSYLTWNNSSLKQSHSRACPLVVFKQWPNQIRQFCSRSFVTRCFVALAFYFGLVANAFHRLWRHCCQEMTYATRQSKHPTDVPSASLVLSIYDFGQVNSYFFLSRNIMQLYFGLVGPKRWVVFVTLFSFEFTLSMFILLPGTIRLVWLGFVQ